METIRDDRPTGDFITSLPSPLPVIPGYEVLELVGRGGMGKVYRAQSLALGRTVAVKVLAEEPDEKTLARFREETRAIASLQHPNIAQVFEAGFVDGRPFYTQEFLEGGTLAQLFAGTPQDPVIAARFLEAVARAIEHSHNHGILHRDLKPANVLLTLDRTPKVTDFGLAKHFNTTAGAAKTVSGGGLTRTGEIIGTPGYMPPEQASGVVSALGPGTDVYGLGAMLYEALTGRPPFQSPDPLQTVLMVLSMEPVSPRTLQPTTPRDLETICLKCLEKSPRKRYPSAGQLADDLKRFLNGEAILARPVGFVERAAKWARRKPWQAGVVGLIAVLFVLLAGGFVWVSAKNGEIREANGKLGTANTELEATNEKLTVAKGETEKTLALTLVSLDRYYFEFSQKLRDLPRGGPLRLEVLGQARKTLDAIHTFRPNDPDIRAYQIEGFDKLGNAEMAAGDADAALADYRRSRELAAELEARLPEEPSYRRYRALADTKISAQYRLRGKAKEADALLATVTPTLAELLATSPNDTRVWALEYAVTIELFNTAFNARNEVGSEKHARRLVAVAEKLATAEPTDSRKIDAIEWHAKLAYFLMTGGDLTEPAKVLARAEELLKGLADAKSVPARRARGLVFGTVGDLNDRLKKPQPAHDAYRIAAAEYEFLVTEFPENVLYHYQLAEILLPLGVNCLFLNKLTDATANLERAVKETDAVLRGEPTHAAAKVIRERAQGILTKLANLPKPGTKS